MNNTQATEIAALRAYLHHLYGYICEIARHSALPAIPQEPEAFIRRYTLADGDDGPAK
jgi:hypothetical protein